VVILEEAHAGESTIGAENLAGGRSCGIRESVADEFRNMLGLADCFERVSFSSSLTTFLIP
jgi:hypothetical protein